MWKKSKIAYCSLTLILCIALIVVAVASVFVQSAKYMRCKEKLIIDTDAGSDDAVAILLLLEVQQNIRQCSYEIVAITCTYGNTNEEQVEINVRKTLTVADRLEIPIYAGASRPILQHPDIKPSYVFGNDGFGDAKFDEKILGQVDHTIQASVIMNELSKLHEGELNILILGPTTNVALACILDRGFVGRLKHIFVMGSSIAGVGNIRPGIEYNFAADPEANFVLLDSVPSSKVKLLPWETAMNSGYTNEWRKNALNGYDSKIARFLNGIESMALNVSNYYPADGFAAAAMLMEDTFVKKSFETHVQAIYEGAARGATFADYTCNIKPYNAKIIQQVDIEVYKSLFLCMATKNCTEFLQ